MYQLGEQIWNHQLSKWWYAHQIYAQKLQEQLFDNYFNQKEGKCAIGIFAGG